MPDAASLIVRVEPASGELPAVGYRWDVDTDILMAAVPASSGGEGLSGTIEVQGEDGSWINFDVADGRIRAVEIAIWPELRTVPGLAAPRQPEAASIVVPSRRQPGTGVAAIEVDTSLTVEVDEAEQTFHFTIGGARQARTVRLARQLLLDLDSRCRIAGIWLLEVPPFPEQT